VGSERSLSVRVGYAPKSGTRFALDVALDVPPGITVVLGPSGAGKTSLLSAIAGLIRPDHGRIALGADVLFDAALKLDVPVHRRKVGLVFQTLALFPHLTAEANVAYGLFPRLGRAERRRRAHEWLERVHVAHVAGRYPPTLSGGEAQRVALARALATEPTILLLDEPFSAIDAALRSELRSELKSLVGRVAIPTLFVTHDTDDARALADRVVQLSAGRVVSPGQRP
jgi:ABC-type sulfate/molybdate transport systems ATPase subunit